MVHLSPALKCWHCGADLASIPVPIGRRDQCPACRSDLHVCRMCTLMDTTAAKNCREPTVEEVRDKERANFCDLFSPDPQAHQRDPGHQARQARQDLDSLFGLETGAGSGDQGPGPDAGALLEQRRQDSEQARQALEDLFGLDPDQSPGPAAKERDP